MRYHNTQSAVVVDDSVRGAGNPSSVTVFLYQYQRQARFKSKMATTNMAVELEVSRRGRLETKLSPRSLCAQRRVRGKVDPIESRTPRTVVVRERRQSRLYRPVYPLFENRNVVIHTINLISEVMFDAKHCTAPTSGGGNIGTGSTAATTTTASAGITTTITIQYGGARQIPRATFRWFRANDSTPVEHNTSLELARISRTSRRTHDAGSHAAQNPDPGRRRCDIRSKARAAAKLTSSNGTAGRRTA